MSTSKKVTTSGSVNVTPSPTQSNSELKSRVESLEAKVDALIAALKETPGVKSRVSGL